MKQNNLREINESFILEGNGKTKKEAVNAAFTKLKDKISTSTDYPIIHMFPNEVHILELNEVDTTEAYMFFFMKRTKKSFQVKLEVEVVIKYIEI